MRNQKGLSDVVTVVLIILLALAAVVIVANFLIPFIRGTGSELEMATECLTVEAKPTGCDRGTWGSASSYTVKPKVMAVLVSKGNADVKSIKAIVTKSSTGETMSGTATAPSELLKSVTITLDSTPEVQILTGDMAKTVVVLEDEDGNEYECEASPTQLGCP